LTKRAHAALRKERFRDAEKAAEAILELRKRAQGEGHWETRDARWHLETVRQFGRLSEAERRALVVSGQKAAQCQALEAKFLHARALPLRREVLEVRRKVLGEGHPHTATGYQELALCLSAQNRHALALPLYEKALAIRRKALGEDHPSTGHSHLHLAKCLGDLGKPEEALPPMQKAVAIYRKALGEEDALHVISNTSLATFLDAQGQYAQAQPPLERALAITRKVLGEENTATATAYGTLASNLSAQGKHSLALPLIQKALEIDSKLCEEGHPRLALWYNRMASCLDEQGLHAQALLLHEKALAIRRRVRGELHEDTATSYNSVAVCLIRLGKPARSGPFFEKALSIYRKVLGERHRTTATAYSNLAALLDLQGRHAEAVPLCEKALAFRLEANGEAHPDTAASYLLLAKCLQSQRKFAQAQPLYEKALAIRRKVLGENHPVTARTYNNLAACLQDQKQHVRALEHFRKALAIDREVLGEEHPQTAACSTNMASCLTSMGRVPEAVRLLQASLPGQEATRFGRAETGFDRALAATDHHSPRALLAVGLARLGQSRNAWRHAEASLARGLLDDLAGDDSAHAARLRSLDERQRSLDQRLLHLWGLGKRAPDQERLREELLKQLRALRAERARLTAMLSARRLEPLEAVQSALPADAALVFWLELPQLAQVWACAVRREGPPTWAEVKGTGEGGAWVRADVTLPRRLFHSLRSRDSTPKEREQLLAALRSQRLGPLREALAARGKLPAVRQLLVVPTGALALVPVELLVPEMQVRYVPSGSTLARLKREHRPLRGDSLLAVGDPVFTPAALPAPPGHGLLLGRVLPKGRAGRAGLRAGDVLLSLGDQRLDTVDDLKKALSGGAEEARYWREGKEGRARLAGSDALGAAIDKRPGPIAVQRWRELERAVERGTGHKALPGTAREVKALAALVPGTTKLLGSQASEQELDRLREAGKLRRYRLLHFATHGEVNQDDPDRSRLILAQDRLPDSLTLVPGQKAYTGELTVQAIREKWQLDCDLVVLSACQTALGKNAGGEGLLGFAQGFLSRGARSVVLSRWQVDDEATALLMVRFYENLLGKRKGLKPLPRAEALQEAKDWLCNLSATEVKLEVERLPRGKAAKPVPVRKEAKPFAHPYYWAAFVLVGDPS
jgi:tetratricopeptide (TPR) repeat protein